MSDEQPDGPTEPPTGPPSFAPMDSAGPTDEGDPGAPSTAQFAPVPGGVIAGGAAARLGLDGMPPDLAPPAATPPDEGATQALGVVQPPPAVAPPPPAPPPPAPRPFDPGVTLDGLPLAAPQWGAGPLDGGPPTLPGAPALAKTDEQPAVGWVTGGAAAGVVGADALAGTGIRPPGAPTFQPPPPPPPGALPPPHSGAGPAGPGGPAPARSGGGATPWILAVLLVAALVAVVVLVVRGSSLTDDRDEADARADEMADSIDEITEERDELQDQIEELEDQIQALEEDGGGGSTIPPDLEQLQEELDQRQAAIAALEDELDAREAELDAREAELDQREQDLEDREEGLGEGELTAAADLLIGDCILEPIDPTLGVPESVTVVACAASHQGEVFAQEDVGDAIGGAFPGEAVLLEGAVAFCGGPAFEAYFGGTPAATGLLPAPRLPSATAWAAGDTVVVCAAYPADGQAVTGSQAG
jgi:hypothetical protein